METARVALDQVSRHYQMGGTLVRALDGVTLTIEPGELVAIIGQSGSGKSTMLNILGCLDRPTEGTYHLGPHDVGTLDEDALAHVRNELIGFVFQSFQLLPRQPAWENVALPLMYDRRQPRSQAERRALAVEKLSEVGLGDRVNHLPNEMSGGQRQRVAVARALVNTPTMVLADEPTGNLDSKTSEEVLELFTSLHHTHGCSVVIVTHEPEVADRCDRVITLKDGQVLSDAPPGSGQ